jgi:ubiquinone/menaquinone biosynthesis C-methylase UbiE
MPAGKPKPFRGIGMDGFIANWYAKNTAADIEDFRQTARMIAPRLASGAQILELARGPGSLAIELATLGSFFITGVEISL